MKKVLSTILSIVLIMGSLGAAYAVSSYLSSFNSTYGTSGTVLNTCALCHPAGGGTNAGNLNNFADDYANNSYDFLSIENLDSDGDGFANIAEINARTFPGNTASHPAAGDTTLPVVTEFVIPLTSSSLTVTITTFAATDNIGVMGYMVTETATVPEASASGWSGVKPLSYNFGSTGAKTLYAWAKDAAGNISAPLSAVTAITINPLLYASFGTGNGLWQWELGVWKQINPAVPTNVVASGSLMFASVPGSGVWQWDGSVWTRIDSTVATNMVASDSVLYATFTGAGLYQWKGTAWSRIDKSIPTSMVASGSALYATFTGAGLYQWNGAAWSRIDKSIPTSMVAAGSTLYAGFTGSGLYKWDGSALSPIDKNVPTNMVASGAVLYADYGALGLYKWENNAWTRLSTTDPSIMVAGF